MPSAPIVTARFADYVQRDGRSHGMNLRWTFPPYPVGFIPREILHDYVYGNDPISGAPLMEEVIFALTQPLTDAEKNYKAEKRPERPRTLEPATEADLHHLFLENGWTDGLPIILPTEERVAEMLTGTDRDAQEYVGMMSVTTHEERLQYTVERAAVNAVMAGARPEHFPVILALGASGRPSMPSSTTSFASMMVVNGPIRNEIGMNYGLGALSPVNYANSVIGRAWTLMSICWGYARPEKTLWSSQGSNLVYNNMCVAENEERSVWTPFHVDKGFRADESVVSIFRGWAIINSPGAASNRSLGEELNIELAVIPPVNSAATIILDPLVARNLKENEGFNTKQDYCRWLSENIKMPAGQYWKTDYIDMLAASEAYQGVEPYASWKKLPDDELIAPYHTPESINIIVVGGETSPLWKASDYRHTASESIDKWRANSDDECEDGSCGLPDEPVDYD